MPPRHTKIYGHTIRAPRPTWTALFWGLIYVGLPIMAIASLADFLVWFLGQ